MKSLPENWNLVDEWDNNFIYENEDISFCVDVTFTEECFFPYTIGFHQLKGIFTLIGFENGAYSTHATSREEAKEKAIEMILFIDKITNDKSLPVQ